MPKIGEQRGLGYVEPEVPGKFDAKFLQTLESSQLAAIDERAAAIGMSRNAYVRKALYHYMDCKG